LVVIDASAVAIEVEFCGYTDKESHAGDLQQQSGFKKEFAKVLLRGADSAVKKLATPMAVKAPMTASRPMKVVTTRPGWMGE